ncbi:MAG: hypothetical protein AM324_013720 [Candidatus Thorarchaeota archaeon SMTZ1-83]
MDEPTSMTVHIESLILAITAGGVLSTALENWSKVGTTSSRLEYTIIFTPGFLSDTFSVILHGNP